MNQPEAQDHPVRRLSNVLLGWVFIGAFFMTCAAGAWPIISESMIVACYFLGAGFTACAWLACIRLFWVEHLIRHWVRWLIPATLTLAIAYGTWQLILYKTPVLWSPEKLNSIQTSVKVQLSDVEDAGDENNYQTAELRRGLSEPFPYSNTTLPVRLHVARDRVLVDAEFDYGGIPIKFKDSVPVEYPSVFQRKLCANGTEVRDVNDTPICQVIYKEANRIQILGCLRSAKGWVQCFGETPPRSTNATVTSQSVVLTPLSHKPND